MITRRRAAECAQGQGAVVVLTGVVTTFILGVTIVVDKIPFCENLIVWNRFMIFVKTGIEHHHPHAGTAQTLIVCGDHTDLLQLIEAVAVIQSGFCVSGGKLLDTIALRFQTPSTRYREDVAYKIQFLNRCQYRQGCFNRYRIQPTALLSEVRTQIHYLPYIILTQRQIQFQCTGGRHHLPPPGQAVGVQGCL